MCELSLRTRDSFDEVLKTYSNTVYRLAYSRVGNKPDADDILQDVFLRYIRADKVFNDEEHRKAWFIRVTLNCTKSHATSAWNRHRASDKALDYAERQDETDDIGRLETKTAVYDAVLALAPKYRTVIHLFYYEEMSLTEISEALGLGENTVKSQLHRARNILKDKLKGVEFDV